MFEEVHGLKFLSLSSFGLINVHTNFPAEPDVHPIDAPNTDPSIQDLFGGVHHQRMHTVLGRPSLPTHVHTLIDPPSLSEQQYFFSHMLCVTTYVYSFTAFCICAPYATITLRFLVSHLQLVQMGMLKRWQVHPQSAGDGGKFLSKHTQKFHF